MCVSARVGSHGVEYGCVANWSERSETLFGMLMPPPPLNTTATLRATCVPTYCWCNTIHIYNLYTRFNTTLFYVFALVELFETVEKCHFYTRIFVRSCMRFRFVLPWFDLLLLSIDSRDSINMKRSSIHIISIINVRNICMSSWYKFHFDIYIHANIWAYLRLLVLMQSNNVYLFCHA